jgi:Pin2-interacting protein X1
LKSQDPIHTRTGLDAFQGLLWRLNGKSDVELENEANKNENRKLAMWAQARWGGVTFVPGGTLVQGDGYKKPEEEAPEIVESPKAPESQSDMTGSDDKAQRRAGKKSRKEEKRRKRDAGLDDRTSSTESTASNPKAEMTKGTGSLERKGSNGEKAASKEKKKKKRQRPALSADDESSVTTPSEQAGNVPRPSTVYAPPNPAIVNRTTPALPRIGRHVIRGRNIEAKKMAFSDVKMLDQVMSSWIASLKY